MHCLAVTHKPSKHCLYFATLLKAIMLNQAQVISHLLILYNEICYMTAPLNVFKEVACLTDVGRGVYFL